ncbi:hypothetical protein BAE44_0010722 [Dichanthelium oligosanthes]|uniref:Uncharacterized protein n=1 Tax=Dichanthelium oligosanthes TaxID=888268 RepID=A0A1E5VT21_9POAL|nr:hypothetical protein BAE44_0010722 [Dichanthelium oligosanthes]
MADIALLVAEEFEKRVKRGAPGGADCGEAAGDSGGDRRNFGAVAKVWSSWVESASAAASGVRVNVAVQLREMEPKTGLGLAAVDGLFSA